MIMRIRILWSAAALCLSTSAALAQATSRSISTRDVRSGTTIEVTVALAAPYMVGLRYHGGEAGSSGSDAFTATEVRQWLAGKQGPSPDAVLERAPSAGLGDRVKDASAPLGDIKTGRRLYLVVEDDEGAAKYSLVFQNVAIPLSKSEARQFLRDIKRAADVADSLAGGDAEQMRALSPTSLPGTETRQTLSHLVHLWP